MSLGELTPVHQLTQQFYDWEKRGRGWQVWPYPVFLEPPFRPFLFHTISSQPITDDARTSHPLVRAFQGLVELFHKKEVPTEPIPEWETEPEPLEYVSGHSSVIQVGLPANLKVPKETSEQLLLNLSYCSSPVSFEFIGTPKRLVLQFVCQEEDKQSIKHQIQAHFPETVLYESSDVLHEHWDVTQNIAIVDFGLSHEFMLPLRTLRGLEPDIWTGMVGGLSNLENDELGVLQIIFQRAAYPWTESVIRACSDWEGRSFFADAPEMLGLAKEKISHPLFAAVIRMAAQAENEDSAYRIIRNLGASLSQLANPGSNELIPLSNDGYSYHDHQNDLLFRQSHRSGMILNSEELVSLVHLPSASVHSSKLRLSEKKVKSPPHITRGHDLVLGHNVQEKDQIPVTLNPEQRTKHIYIIGASGTGKSTLLLNIILQDIEEGRGIGVLDPHGDLVDQILGRVPDHREKDVILFDPSDIQSPLGFNILSAHSEAEKNLLASDLVAVFRRFSTSWGDQMNSVLANAILAFLESSQGGTLLDLRRFLLDSDFRRSFLRTVQDWEISYYWQKEFPLLTGTKSLAPLLTRLDTFTRPKLIRYLLAQKENKLDFRKIMDEGKIFLAKLAQGAIGEENSYLLGSLLVSKFHQSALSRQIIPESQRSPFFLYIDEFHNFLTPSLVSLLSAGRKFGMGLVLAHQELRQLSVENASLASAVLANPYTRICFRVGDFDSKKLEDGFSSFTSKDLQNLGTGEAICRVERSEYDFTLKTQPLPKINREEADKKRRRIQELSRSEYGTPLSVIEAELEKKYVSAADVLDEETEAKTEKPRVATPSAPPPSFSPPSAPPLQPIPISEKIDHLPKAEKEERHRPIRPQPQLMGKGGQQHKYLQHLIKRYAEDKGYRATIEKPLRQALFDPAQSKQGKPITCGQIDVVLEKEGQPSIACEVSVTTSPEQEIGNLEKCLEAGYETIVLLSPDRKTLNSVKELANNRFTQDHIQRFHFLTPEDYFFLLEELSAQSAAGEGIVKGYKVKSTFKALTSEEKERRKKEIADAIWKSMRRMEK